ncbi:diphosphomevalonate decarboxylase [Candidatus Gottesmanbacteria bacterium]|nr:diphosphomevalonate decarboxylase [Candidatus Gottesmanbacteria bacterium]
MKATAIAPANIAFIKYWGKKNRELRLPLNDSISMNLSACLTTTTVDFSKKYKKDEVILLLDSGQVLRSRGSQDRGARMTKYENKENQRVIRHLNLIRKIGKINLLAKVVSTNSFPKSAGIASSASGFAALTVAGCAAAGLRLTEKELTILARLGSGSACRSVPDGFVEWKYGEDSNNSYAYSLYPDNYWDLRDTIVLVSDKAKKTSSNEGMENIWTSPLMEKRLKEIPGRLKKIKLALKEKNFSLLGTTCEEDCFSMHKVANTQKPPIFYWTDKTEKIIEQVKSWRRNGLEVYFTIDAGPNVHLLCESKNEAKVISAVKQFDSKLKYIINKPTQGARIINDS